MIENWVASIESLSNIALSKENFATAFEKDFDEAETYRDRYSKYSSILEKMIQASATSEEKWLKFWSQFKRIHEDVNLHKEVKFQYLIQSMVVGTRVRDFVDGYPPTAEKYDKCIDSLRMRFGREELQWTTKVFVHLQYPRKFNAF
ncbi:uncharacterized protein TNCV_900251 [Trichonephila clavipes]|nr:uncharacterized protein TNCV_900251 [Trichonephila clavipes]